MQRISRHFTLEQNGLNNSSGLFFHQSHFQSFGNFFTLGNLFPPALIGGDNNSQQVPGTPLSIQADLNIAVV